MMEEDITPERTANAIMQDTSFSGVNLIVEGKKDLKLFGRFIIKNEVRVKVAFGNEKVKGVLRLLDARGFEKKIGIIDRDFNEILDSVHVYKDLFHTDYHDIEIMMLDSSALESVLNVCCSSEDVESFEKTNNSKVREILLSLGKEVGYLKMANKINDLGLLFKPRRIDGKQLKYRDFICNKTLRYKGSVNLIDTVINYSRSRSKKIKCRKEIEKYFIETSKKDYDLYQLVNGHDVSHILYMLMKTVLNSKNKILFDYNTVEDALILGYEYAEFKNSNLFIDINNWSRINNLPVFK